VFVTKIAKTADDMFHNKEIAHELSAVHSSSSVHDFTLYGEIASSFVLSLTSVVFVSIRLIPRLGSDPTVSTCFSYPFSMSDMSVLFTFFSELQENVSEPGVEGFSSPASLLSSNTPGLINTVCRSSLTSTVPSFSPLSVTGCCAQPTSFQLPTPICS
jgi:hypothetical protein